MYMRDEDRETTIDCRAIMNVTTSSADDDIHM